MANTDARCCKFAKEQIVETTLMRMSLRSVKPSSKSGLTETASSTDPEGACAWRMLAKTCKHPSSGYLNVLALGYKSDFSIPRRKQDLRIAYQVYCGHIEHHIVQSAEYQSNLLWSTLEQTNTRKNNFISKNLAISCNVLFDNIMWCARRLQIAGKHEQASRKFLVLCFLNIQVQKGSWVRMAIGFVGNMSQLFPVGVSWCTSGTQLQSWPQPQQYSHWYNDFWAQPQFQLPCQVPFFFQMPKFCARHLPSQ